MGCCGSNLKKSKKNNIENKSRITQRSPLKNILVWGTVVIVTIGFLGMMF